MSNSSKPSAVDLFCGCGGLSLGLERAGFDVLEAHDSWRPAIDTYNENFDHVCHETDLSDVTGFVDHLETVPRLIAGGPPCQDFSSAGKRNESLGRAELTLSFAQIVCEVKPQFFLMENVAQARASRTMANARTVFRDAGYGISEHVLDASLCGVPQRRKRLFLLGSLNQADQWAAATIEARQSTDPMTVRDYLGENTPVDFYYRHPRNYNRRAIFSVDEPSPTVRGVNRPVPSGYRGHHLDKAPVGEVRPLTTHERSLIQTFPSEFNWLGSKTEVEQMIGNAVPVNLAKFVATVLLEDVSAPGLSNDKVLAAA